MIPWDALLFLAWVWLPFLIAGIAADRGHDSLKWLVRGWLLTPVIAAPLLLVVGRKKAPATPEQG